MAPDTETMTPQERLEAATARRDELKARIESKVLAGEDFSEASIAYALALNVYQEALAEANAGEVYNETAALGEVILTWIENSPLTGLMGKPVESVYWKRVPATEEAEELISVVLNVAIAAPRAGKPRGSSGGGNGKQVKTQFSVDGGEEMGARDFVIAYGPDDVQADALVKANEDGARKWPTKPVFIAKTLEHLRASGHTVNVREPAPTS